MTRNHHRPNSKHSLFPCGHPPHSRSILKADGASQISTVDHALVWTSSLCILGSFVWIPLLLRRCYKEWKKVQHDNSPRGKRLKRRYASLLLSAFLVFVVLRPHRHPIVGRILRVGRWRLWKAWLNYVAFEVILDETPNSHINQSALTRQKRLGALELTQSEKDQAILAVVPHGVVPFGLAFAFIPELAKQAFGTFRPVVATATRFFPFVGTMLRWFNAVDASKHDVNRALTNGHSIGLSPGGIAEIYLSSHPPNDQPSSHINDEYALLSNRKGFCKLAVEHNIPIIPIYVFGSTKLLRQWKFPDFVERWMKLLRIGVAVFYGRGGWPVPYRERLMYVMGQPLYPPELRKNYGVGEAEEKARCVEELHYKFCQVMVDLFERHKRYYGWEDKRLIVV